MLRVSRPRFPSLRIALTARIARHLAFYTIWGTGHLNWPVEPTNSTVAVASIRKQGRLTNTKMWQVVVEPPSQPRGC